MRIDTRPWSVIVRRPACVHASGRGRTGRRRKFAADQTFGAMHSGDRVRDAWTRPRGQGAVADRQPDEGKPRGRNKLGGSCGSHREGLKSWATELEADAIFAGKLDKVGSAKGRWVPRVSAQEDGQGVHGELQGPNVREVPTPALPHQAARQDRLRHGGRRPERGCKPAKKKDRAPRRRKSARDHDGQRREEGQGDAGRDADDAKRANGKAASRRRRRARARRPRRRGREEDASRARRPRPTTRTTRSRAKSPKRTPRADGRRQQASKRRRADDGRGRRRQGQAATTTMRRGGDKGRRRSRAAPTTARS